MSSNHPQSTAKSQGEGPYVIAISGLPRGYTWQDLKDTVRPKASHGIWAFMQQPSREADTGAGWVKVQRLKEAQDLYDWLTDDRSGKQKDRRLCGLSVCLYDYYGNIKNSNLTSRNSLQEQYARQALSLPQASWHNLTASQPVIVPGNPQGNLVQAMAGLQLDPQELQAQQDLQARQALFQQQQRQAYNARIMAAQYAAQQSTQAAVFAQTSSGTPINISAGYYETEHCGVFVHGLNYKARTRDVQKLFSGVGRVVECNIVKDSRTGKSKGYTTVLFQTGQEARRAIEEFDGFTFMERQLEVRIDKESTKILGSRPESSSSRNTQSTEPLIVNGSGGSPRGRG